MNSNREDLASAMRCCGGATSGALASHDFAADHKLHAKN
jgi:hypothetical protein